MEQTHWKKQFNYDYMGSYSLPDGKDVVLTIKKTQIESVTGMNGVKADCFVCYFEESDKPMILNRTNCKTIEKITKTPYIEQWAGKRVQLGIDAVSAFGDMVDALRIRKVVPPPAKPVDYSAAIKSIQSCTTLEQLQAVYMSLSPDAKTAVVNQKDEMKQLLTVTTEAGL